MNNLAVELNKTLESSVVLTLLSEYGKRFYFPKGIAAQSGEAKKNAKKLNATIGMAISEGNPMYLEAIHKHLNDVSPKETYTYAPVAGVQKLRDEWAKHIRNKNPELGDTPISQPTVVPGLTNGITQLADMFVDPGDSVIVPDMFWGNYRLIFEGRREAALHQFPFFKKNLEGMDIDALKDTVRNKSKNGKAVLILNFPNNPTGYSPTTQEAEEIARAVEKLGNEGYKLLVIVDDAYFGLFYEENLYTQSLFAKLAGIHENILAVKADGATKEDFVWGFRIGFLTFGCKGLSADQYEAIITKLKGSLRASISNANHLAQTLLLKAFHSEGYQEEKRRNREILFERYKKVQDFLKHNECPLKPMPFNSGYFMNFYSPKGRTEELRQDLLFNQGIGTISIQDMYLRVAYSSVDIGQIDELYSAIFETARRML